MISNSNFANDNGETFVEIEISQIDFPSQQFWEGATALHKATNGTDLIGVASSPMSGKPEEDLAQLIVVRPMPSGRYQLITGGGILYLAVRRNWKRIPAICRAMTDLEASTAKLVGNCDRSDFDSIAVGDAITELAKPTAEGGHGLTAAEIAVLCGKSKAWVYEKIQLLGQLARSTKDELKTRVRNIPKEGDRQSLLEQWFWAAYVPARLLRKSEKTRTQYVLTIRRFDDFCQERLGRLMNIAEITEEHVDAFKTWRLDKSPSLKGPTLNKDLRQLAALANFAVRRRIRATPLYLEREPIFVDPPNAWSVEELRKILGACLQETGDICGVPANLWWRALILTLLNTGARISAMMTARWDRFDELGMLLNLPSTSQKNRQGQTWPLSSVVFSALLAIKCPSRVNIFDWPFDQNVHSWPSLNKAYKRILARACLSHTAKDLFHRLRRSTATFLAAAGGTEVARQQLGHSTSAVTRAYIDPTKIQQPSAKDLIPWDRLTGESGLEKAG